MIDSRKGKPSIFRPTHFSRRNFVRLGMGDALSLRATRLLAQGVSSHTAKPLPRPAASGHPFNAHFVDVAAAAGLHRPVIYGDVEIKKYIVESTGGGCAFVDYDRDGHLDLFVSNYVRFSFEHAPAPGENNNCKWKGIPVECGPRGLATGKHSLYRNNGDGTFTEVTQQAGISKAASTYGMTAVAADFDEDGC